MRFDIIIVSGFSGSGKGTILKKLLSFHPELGLIKSYTTRKKRDDADFYSFVTLEEFLSLKRNNYFLECNQYSDEWYGTPLHAVQSCINNGKIAVIEIDLNGFRQIMESSVARKYRVLSVCRFPLILRKVTEEIPQMTCDVEEYKHRMQHLIWLLGD